MYRELNAVRVSIMPWSAIYFLIERLISLFDDNKVCIIHGNVRIGLAGPQGPADTSLGD